MIVAEIGFNHLGRENLALEMVESLIDSRVDAITFQIREKSHRQKKPYAYLDDAFLSKIIKKIKESRKKIGIALCDVDYIDFFENLNVDFYKIIRNDILNENIIKKIFNTGKKVYVSTGMASDNQISKFVNKIGKFKDNCTLIHTQLSYEINDCNLYSIEKMKKHRLNVGFGNHSSDIICMYMSLCFFPSDIFFYVKNKDNMLYPDHDHAIDIPNIDNVIKNIEKYKKSIGTGKKQSMINKIKEGK